MTRLVLCAPLGVEARALRRGVSRPGARTTVVRTGMGPTRSARWGRDLGARLGDDSGVAVAGVCGGVGADVRPGDVVVASEVRGPDGVIELPAAPLLAGDLRRRGFARVHVGPVASRPGVVTGDERERLAADGVLAVDTESTWLLARLGDRPRAVVRVVVDTAEHPLAHAGTVRRGLAALRTLSRLRPVLDEWSAVLGPRQVLLAGPRSFCAGVDRAIEIVERALAMHGAPVYVRKQIVHNAHVVGDLERQGAVFVEEVDEIPAGSVVVFSAHGVSPAVRADAEARGLRVVDATCPLVAKVHAEARRFAARGDTVVLIGHAGHEEPEGTLGEAPQSTVLVETVEDARTLRLRDARRSAYLMQTTLSVEESAEVVGVLRERFPDIQEPGGDDICYATTNRQRAVREVARDSELVLVVGSRNSSNSLRLVETAQREGAQAHLVDDAGEVDLAWLSGVRRVGVTAGASAPPALVDGLVRALGGLGPVEVEDRQVTTESVQFTLPKEVRG